MASTIGEAPSAEVLPASDHLDHDEDTENLAAWQDPSYEPPVNAKMHYDHLLQRNGLITPTTHNGDRFNQRVADDIFTLAEAAHAVKRRDIFNRHKPSAINMLRRSPVAPII